MPAILLALGSAVDYSVCFAIQQRLEVNQRDSEVSNCVKYNVFEVIIVLQIISQFICPDIYLL